MRIYTARKRFGAMKIILPLLLSAIALGALLYGVFSVPESATIEQLDITRRNIQNALVECYAIEGIYPRDIAYLEQHYGLYIDKKKFNVFYETDLGSYILPSVKVSIIGAGDHIEQ